MRVLVTGAAGFLGSHLTDALLADGNSVLGADNLCTGSLENLQHLQRETRFEFQERDICVPFDSGPVDYVFNFASPASPADYLKLGIETLMVGSMGTRNMLELAKKYGAKFLHASTSECYGDPAGASADRGVLGACESDRAALRLRRVEAFLRGAGDGVSPLLWCGHAAGAHLQYLWPATAGRRWPGDFQLS